MKFIFLIISLLMFTFQLAGQEKVEMEQRIDSQEVPEKARTWVKDAYEGIRKVKWYYENSSDGASYEAKLKWKGQRHSVEFNTNGTLEDIEVVISWKELSPAVQEQLASYFKAYEKYSIRKIQRQWKGDADELEDAIDEKEVENVETSYEIEFHGRKGSENELWEGLFDEHGKLVKKRKIVLRPTDNLNY